MEVPSSSIVLANTEVKNVLEESDGKWGCCVKLSRHNFTILIWTWYPCTSLQHKTCLPSWLHTLLKQPCTRGFVTFKPHGDPNRYACFHHFVEPRNENRAHWALASDMLCTMCSICMFGIYYCIRNGVTKPPNGTSMYMYICNKAFPQYVLLHYIISPRTDTTVWM